MLDELQQAGALYRGAQGVADPLRLLREQGLNMVRLRLWHTPAAGQDGLREVLAMAERVDAQGLDLMLTIHYSDTWADPSQQAKPALWQGQPFSALRDSVRSYTERTVRALVDQGTSPALIQIGNEITGGMLWPEGRVGGAYDTPAQWRQLADLLQAGIDGVRAADDQVATMLHVDNGGSAETVRWFFDNIRNAGVDFDVIGLSYYPWWHGTLADLADTLATAAERYQRPVMVVETAYPWTLDWFDTTHNIVGLPEQLLAGFPASPEGQAAFIAAVRQAVADVKDGLGQGICYWAPEHLATTSVGSPWENLALFDDTGMLLPGAAALGGRPSTVAVGVPAAASAAVTVHPNPVASQLTMRLTTAAPVCPEVTVYTALGQIQAQTSLACGVGERQAVMDTSTWPPGVYLYTVVASDAVRHRGMFTVMR
ncbi:MAG: glycosyl hydrolase 53 family protein [Bacteroidota bacterium]